MQIVHKISLSINESIRSKLLEFGIATSLGFTSFEIEENSADWKPLQNLIVEWGAVDFVMTHFSQAELAEASFLEMNPTWHWSYPQPEEKRGYMTATYNIDNLCQECGCGAIQRAPFRMKGEPGWKRNHILQLNWVFDKFFTRPEVWETVFKIFNISRMEVYAHAHGTLLDSVVQLVSQGSTTCGNALAQYPHKVCGICGQKKYLPITRGFFPSFAHEVRMDYFTSDECFGSGASCSRAVFISQKLYQAMMQFKIKGASFTAVQ